MIQIFQGRKITVLLLIVCVFNMKYKNEPTIIDYENISTQGIIEFIGK